MSTMLPVKKSFPSEANQTAVLATSSGLATRFNGLCAFISSLIISATRSVSTKPGAIV